ncbi:MAG: hypothetical protein JW876_03020 [Candidatus Krumholzibacteriota bacterium]|nr:hypothetical protein [Candidatus Krumholzibacteriota bacterium]
MRRPVEVLVAILLLAGAMCGPAASQTAVIDTLELVPLPPDSMYLRRDGAEIVIGWYPPPDSTGAVIGSYDFRNWFGVHSVNEGSRVTLSGAYIGNVDLTLKFEKVFPSTAPVVIGGSSPADTSIRIFASLIDPRNRTYTQTFNIGTNHYTPGTPVDVILRTEDEPRLTIDTGISVAFGEGVVDTSLVGGLASFTLDLQDFEGFHVFRGLSPFPSEMTSRVELSKEDGYIGYEADLVYFSEWPKIDDFGRPYYEWVDKNVYVGFTYHYAVTTYDRGYFKGFFRHNKWDSYVCEDPDFGYYYDPPEETLDCEASVQSITMTVDTGTDVKKIYAVPNPYRTGTSAESWPYYHNFPDNSIKFYNVPAQCELRIFTVSGDLVWETVFSSAGGEDGVITWDVKNKEGRDVGSGVYVYKVEASNGDHMYGRIVVIR